MTGQVSRRRALISVVVRVSGQPDQSIECLVDTGFSGALALPPPEVAALGLPFLEDTPANLANDQNLVVPVYAATVVWNGVERAVRVLAIGRRPLLGTTLLDGNHLGIDFVEGGSLTITPHA